MIEEVLVKVKVVNRRVTLSAQVLAAALFLLVALVGMVATGSYAAGRANSGPPIHQTAQASTMAAPPPQTEETELVPEPPTPAQPCVAGSGEPLLREPEPGALYLQLAATTRGPSKAFVEYFRLQGYDAHYAAGPGDSIFRVLIGPFRDKENYAPVMAELERDDFRPFPRRVPVGGGEKLTPSPPGAGSAPGVADVATPPAMSTEEVVANRVEAVHQAGGPGEELNRVRPPGGHRE